jgi:hypothetical protein
VSPAHDSTVNYSAKYPVEDPWIILDLEHLGNNTCVVFPKYFNSFLHTDTTVALFLLPSGFVVESQAARE